MVQEISFWRNAIDNTEAWNKIQTELMLASLVSPQYVRIEGRARNGSIGIVDFSKNDRVMNEEQYEALRSAGSDAFEGGKYGNLHESLFGRDAIGDGVNYPAKAPVGWAEYMESAGRNGIGSIQVRMDSGKFLNIQSFDTYGYSYNNGVKLTWLKGYEGPTVDKFEKVSKETRKANAPKFKDKYGAELEVGDFVAVVIDGDLGGAMISKLSDSGKSAYVKADNGKEVLITNDYKIMKIDGGTKGRVATRKLSAAK